MIRVFPTTSLVLLVLLAAGGLSRSFAQTRSAKTPEGHFRIEKPGRLDKANALTVYRRIGRKMARGYALSADRTAKTYRRWRRFNNAPYLSATHGNRYINNYGNAKARGYSELKPGGKLPAGAVLAKDSFTVTNSRGIFAGALFIMEKLQANRSPSTGDWRYLQIMPDGSLFGDSTGDGASKMKFCHGCHSQVAETDYLYKVPARYAKRFGK